MVAGEPDLSEVRREPVRRKPLPDSGREGRASLVKSKSMKRMLDPIRKACVMPLVRAQKVSIQSNAKIIKNTHKGEGGDLFIIVGSDAQSIKPCNARNAETTNSIPNTNGLDPD